MKYAKISLGVIPLLFVLGCGKDGTLKSAAPAVQAASGEGSGALSQLPDRSEGIAVVRSAGIPVTVTTPEEDHRFLVLRPRPNRHVAEKTVAIEEFHQTLEKTRLRLEVSLDPAVLAVGKTELSLYHEGRKLDSAQATVAGRAPVKVALGFRTPSLSKKERAIGFSKVSYDLQVGSPGKLVHVPFSFAIYDDSQPTYVEPRRGECVIYHAPERASGCYQNRTRSTQEVVFNDNVTHGRDVSVQFSGGLNITASIVTLAFGVQESVTDSTQVSSGSEIHFTNCIECASVIYRQRVETVRMGDVYDVMADGSLSWAGETMFRNGQVAYEFASTGSESQNYDCDIQSQLPVGTSPECHSFLDGSPRAR